jgi:hypothetical protein
MVIQRGKHQIGIRSRLDAYPFEVWAHREFTPCIVSVFLLVRVIERRTFRSTGISRVIATPGPVPLQSPHLTRSCDVAGSYSGFAAQEVLCTPGLLHYRCSTRCGLRPRGLISHCPLPCTDAWLARRSTRSADTQTFPFSGLVSDSGHAPFTSPNPHCQRQWFRVVGSTLPRKASVMLRTLAYFPSQ